MNAIEQEKSVRVISGAKSWIESEAVRQLYATARLDGIKSAVGLPDLHPGRGHPVGAAFVSDGVVHPQIIGGDIGCGMALWQTDLPTRKVKLDRWAKLPFDLEAPWEGDMSDWLTAERLPSTGFDGVMGTLGAGNHFVEAQHIDDTRDKAELKKAGLDANRVFLLVHSGSRGLGEAVLQSCEHAACASGLRAESDAAAHYLGGHDLAVRWARANRKLLARRFLEMIGADGECVWDVTHNAISREDGRWVHRKGASPARASFAVVPGSRGAHSYLVAPMGDLTGTAWSLPHGAGRKWNRSESRLRAREHQKASQLAQTPLGSRVICENRNLLYEEAPLAYKNVETVVNDLVEAGLARVLARLRPLLTYKTRTAKW